MIKSTIYLFTIIILGICAYTDYKDNLIYDKFNLMIAILGGVNIMFDFKNIKIYMLSTLVVFCFFLILAIVSKGRMGGGDIKLFTALSLVFGQNMYYIITFTYIITLIVILTLCPFKKYKLHSSIAMAPFILLGTITHFFLYIGI